MVDLDNNRLLRSPGNDHELLPTRWLNSLCRTLGNLARNIRPSSVAKGKMESLLSNIPLGEEGAAATLTKEDSKLLAREFTHFFVELLLHYQLFYKQPSGEFDKEKFTQAQPIEHREVILATFLC